MLHFKTEPSIISACIPEKDDSRALWVMDRCAGPLFTLNRYVPRGFDQYLRVFHPCWYWPVENSSGFRDARHLYQHVHDLGVLGQLFQPMTWAEVAALSDTELTGMTRFWDIMPCSTEESSKPGGVSGPLEGTTEAAIIDALIDALIPHSGENQECLIAVWGGFGSDEIDSLKSNGCALIDGVGNQEHFILNAPLATILKTWRSLLPDRPRPASNSDRWPQALWPTSGEWFFAVPFEMESSYFGGPRSLTNQLIADNRVECMQVPIEADFRGVAK